MYVTMDWNADNKTEIGVVRNSNTWYLDASGDGRYGAGDLAYIFGKTGDNYVTGKWTVPSLCSLTTIHMRNNSFDPQVLTAFPYAGITWINDDDIVHSITMSGPDAMFISGDIPPDARYSHSFHSLEGNFTISSSDHPDMKGTVIIKTPCFVY
jgi:hypothetical protein